MDPLGQWLAVVVGENLVDLGQKGVLPRSRLEAGRVVDTERFGRSAVILDVGGYRIAGAGGGEVFTEDGVEQRAFAHAGVAENGDVHRPQLVPRLSG